MLSRRHFLRTTLGVGTSLAIQGVLPGWAYSARSGNMGISTLSGKYFDLTISKFPIHIHGRSTEAIGVNGTVPAPLLRFREGEDVTMRVKNNLKEDTSIHWHGLLVPFYMDGVPGVSFPGIRPGESFTYKFPVLQNGTYWYHSHSGLQEQAGHYGPIIIDPKEADPVQYDREYILVLGDWTFINPKRIFSMLRKDAESMNFNRPTVSKPLGLGGMWGRMRMSPRDIADVSGEIYTYVINGHSTTDNFNMLFKPQEKIRLRIINAAAMTIFNIRIPELPMTVVATDGLNVQPVETDEFQIGVAETYDVIVKPQHARAFSFVAESIDRSGQVVATLAPHRDMKATEPKLRAIPVLTMKDMGMDHGAMGHSEGSTPIEHTHRGHGKSNQSPVEPSHIDHMNHISMGKEGNTQRDMIHAEKKIRKGPGVANIAAMPVSRLDEPGIGLSDLPHRTLRYSELRSLEINPDPRPPEREVIVHLTSNMERYMWLFDGKKFSEIKKPIIFYEGERVRMTLINNTMMPHPIHLHGMFFELVNGSQTHKPRKHTVIVKPGEKLSVDISAEYIGDWAFHCHLLYHMHAGMMQVVSVQPKSFVTHGKTVTHQHKTIQGTVKS